MTLVGTMEGKHTVDVAVLMNPIIVEYLKGIGDITQTPYRLQRDDMDMEANPILAEKALQELNNENKVTEEQQTEIADLSKDILKEEKKGLMSRPANEEEEI